MKRRVLPASCRQTNRRKALPARCRQHLWRRLLPSGRFMFPMPANKRKEAFQEQGDTTLEALSSRAPKLVQRRQRGLALRVFLAFPFAAAKFDAPMINRTFKKPVMVRTADGLKLILRRLGRTGLQDLLQLTFG